MSFYINGNLSPLEAVKMHRELQVHPVIEEWAQAAEDLAELLDKLDDILLDEKLRSAKQVKAEIEELCANLK